MYPGGSNFENEVMQNTANMSLMFTMYSTTFGNMNFIVQPPMPGKVGSSFPTVPYMPLEALLYQAQSSNPITAPNNVLTGQGIGEQRIGGLSTMNDQFGTNRFMQGFQTGTGN